MVAPPQRLDKTAGQKPMKRHVMRNLYGAKETKGNELSLSKAKKIGRSFAIRIIP